MPPDETSVVRIMKRTITSVSCQVFEDEIISVSEGSHQYHDDQGGDNHNVRDHADGVGLWRDEGVACCTRLTSLRDAVNEGSLGERCTHGTVQGELGAGMKEDGDEFGCDDHCW